jgi:hypothetical protein
MIVRWFWININSKTIGVAMNRKNKSTPRLPSSSEQEKLIETLKARFLANKARHPQVEWAAVESRIKKNSEALASLHAMEETGGEPDVVAADAKTGMITFFDCSAESPAGRRSLCYDAAALASRKENKPKGSALEMAEKMGVEILSEEEYRHLQSLGHHDAKTSSWVETPADIRSRGGALFCDYRYGHVFTYHNGAESYYAARGFRGSLKV